jgi:hypothetical protein
LGTFEFDRFGACGFGRRTAGSGGKDDFDGRLDPTDVIVDATEGPNGLKDVAAVGLRPSTVSMMCAAAMRTFFIRRA